MSIAVLDEILDGAGRGDVKVVATYEMRGYVMFGLPRVGMAVCEGPGGTVDGRRHCVGLGADHVK